MNPLIRELVGCAKDPAAVARFAEEHPVPLVAREHVTFVFVGDADAVNLRHWIFGLPGSYELTRVPHTKVWTCDFELPARSRVEYKIEVVREGHGEWILDPLNPRRAHDPFGANSVCYGPGYERPAWTEHDPEARTGSLDLIAVDSAAFGDRREIPVYLPARFRPTRRYPLLVVHDGYDYLEYSG
ncbi:MAG: hypothetical protein KC731_32745, partial [Myxococcales bacterium]|nr:hypothetical protein [Myxococcales bacterium]